ncbi:MAG: DegT/DnrJ/EryC1/StrS family aminotransferase [Bryobacteraceae bacterium]
MSAQARRFAAAFASAAYSNESRRSAAPADLRVPMVNLAALLQATGPAWRRNLETLFAGMQFVLGEQVEAFEREFAAALGAKHVVGVGSGTAAVELGLRAVGVSGREQEVVTSVLTSPFTAVAICSAGAKPVFADVDPERLLMDPEDAANRITSRTAAIVPVHLYGQVCDLGRLRALAKTARVALVQDACQAHGAGFQGRALSDFSGPVAYSFYPTKNLGCLGDGGAIATRSAKLAAKLRILRDGGRRRDQVSRCPSVNSRLDELQACFLRAFLPRLEEWNSRRARLAALYDEALSMCPAVRSVPRGADSVNHLYVVRVPRRDRLRAYLAQHGIASAVHYAVPLHLHPAFAEFGQGAYPRAERACREILSLPLWPHMADSAVLAVAAHVRQFFVHAGPPRR